MYMYVVRTNTSQGTTYNDLLAKDGAVSKYLHASMTVAASVPVLAASGFPETVQKFVRRVTWIRLSHCQPESDKYYASYTIRIIIR